MHKSYHSIRANAPLEIVRGWRRRRGGGTALLGRSLGSARSGVWARERERERDRKRVKSHHPSIHYTIHAMTNITAFADEEGLRAE